MPMNWQRLWQPAQDSCTLKPDKIQAERTVHGREYQISAVGRGQSQLSSMEGHQVDQGAVDEHKLDFLVFNAFFFLGHVSYLSISFTGEKLLSFMRTLPPPHTPHQLVKFCSCFSHNWSSEKAMSMPLSSFHIPKFQCFYSHIKVCDPFRVTEIQGLILFSYVWIFSFPALFLEEAIFSLLRIFDTIVKNWMAIAVWVYNWVLSISLIHMSGLVPASH